MANVKINGTWNTLKLPYTRVSGTWRPCKQIYTKVGGVWKIAFDLTEADPFDGTGSLSGALTPGYVPWEVLNGTWTKSGGNVAGSTTNSVAAILTGTEDVEVEIDTASTTTGGPGVAFWIQDQANWWGVRFYTEEYFVTTPVNSQYNYFCNGAFVTRNASNVNPGTYASCYFVPSSSRSVTNTGISNTQVCRTCSCPTVNTCSFAGLFAGPNNCSNACSTTNFTNSSCTNNTKGTFCRVSSCAPGCGSCPVSSCPNCPPSPPAGNALNCPSPTTNFLGSFATCNCFCTTNFTNTLNNNAPTYNCPQTVNQYFTVYTNAILNPSPFIPNCTTTANNTSGFYAAYSCIAQVTPFTFYTTTSAVYKRGQLVRSNAGSVSIISNQDFGDVGNLYARTYGNSIDFRQYSTASRGGNASNVVTYSAGSVTKGTKHGIIVTAVPFTQTYNIGRFKVTL